MPKEIKIDEKVDKDGTTTTITPVDTETSSESDVTIQSIIVNGSEWLTQETALSTATTIIPNSRIFLLPIFGMYFLLTGSGLYEPILSLSTKRAQNIYRSFFAVPLAAATGERQNL